MMQSNHHYRTMSIETDVSMLSMPSETHFDASYSSLMHVNAPVTPTRTISPATTLPPPAPHKRSIFSFEKDTDMALPVFPDLSDEAMNDAPTDDGVPTYVPLSMRMDESYDDVDMILLTPSQPERSPLSINDFIVPKLVLKPRVSSFCSSKPVNGQNLPPLPMLPALNPQDDPMDCTKSPIHLKLRPVDFQPEQRRLTAPTA